MSAAGPTGWRRRLELQLGRRQMLALRRALAVAARLRPRVLEVGGRRLACLDRERGEPVLCVHGFGGDKETWLMMAARLPSRLRPVLLDLPGHGGSDPVAPGAATARRQAETIVGALDALGLDRVVLAGNSMGGGIALRVARDFPDRVRALVLVASAAPVSLDSEFLRALQRGANPLIPATEAEAEAFLQVVIERPIRVPRAVRRWVAADRVARGPALGAIFREWSAAAAAGDGLPADVEAIAAPALVVHGACDRVIAPATADWLATRLPRGRAVVLDGIGHVPQLEAPATVARLVTRFLAEV